MRILWKLKKAFVREIIEQMPHPHPPYNTVSSIVRKLEKEGHIGYEAFGKSHRYYPLLEMTAYRKWSLKNLLSHYFNNDPKILLSQFVQEEDLSPEEIRALVDKLKK